MKIVRIYNNNVVVSLDDDNDEMIVIGRGIGFQKKINDNLEMEKVEKIFTIKDKKVQTKLEELVKNITDIYLKICEKIISMINQTSDLELNENIYVTLTDHISMSLEREKRGLILDNPFEFEIEKLYEEEYKLALNAREIIKNETKIVISESEVAFITLHIVNANQNQNTELTLKISTMLSKILTIIDEYVHKEFDKKSFVYIRFIRHLKFFLRRSLERKNIDEEDYFFKIVVTQFPKTYECVEKICNYVAKETDEMVTNTEKGYLMYHLMSIIKDKGKEVMIDEL